MPQDSCQKCHIIRQHDTEAEPAALGPDCGILSDNGMWIVLQIANNCIVRNNIEEKLITIYFYSRTYESLMLTYEVDYYVPENSMKNHHVLFTL